MALKLLTFMPMALTEIDACPFSLLKPSLQNRPRHDRRAEGLGQSARASLLNPGGLLGCPPSLTRMLRGLAAGGGLAA